jgi:hypothetical protein
MPPARICSTQSSCFWAITYTSEANGDAAVNDTTDVELICPEPEPLLTMQALIDRARGGDHTVLPQLRDLLDRDPRLWQEVGDMARQAEAIWIDLIAGPDLLVRESLQRQLAQIRQEVAGPNPSALERLLAERIAINYLIAWHADGMFAQKRNLDLRWAKFACERQSRSQRQLIQAMGALTTLRKLTEREEPTSRGQNCLPPPDVSPAVRIFS